MKCVILGKYFRLFCLSFQLFHSVFSFACHVNWCWRWRQHAPPKRWLTFNGLEGRGYSFITTAVRTMILHSQCRHTILVEHDTSTHSLRFPKGNTTKHKANKTWEHKENELDCGTILHTPSQCGSQSLNYFCFQSSSVLACRCIRNRDGSIIKHGLL